MSDSLQPHGVYPTRLLCHEILQARILEWVAMPSTRDLPDPGIELESLMSPALAGGFVSTSDMLQETILSSRNQCNQSSACDSFT